MSRKLASIQLINDVMPIENADKIELVKVLGWQCVAKKNEFHKGDKCIYFEIDSFLPIKPEFEFLRNSSYKKSDSLGEGFKLKTAKMRGEISQGLCLPLSAFPKLNLDDLPIGTDVTDLLEVKKWEIEEKATTGGTVTGTLPSFIPHSDETRIQNVPDILDEFKDYPYYISTKMDGSSHSIGMTNTGEMFVTGHNYTYKDDGKSSFYEFVKKHDFLNKLKEHLPEIEKMVYTPILNISIQGEYCGPGIQKNRIKLQKPEWYVFTVNINDKRCDLYTSQKIAQFIGATFVPIEERGIGLKKHYPDGNALLERAQGTYSTGGAKEGIVIRTIDPVYSEKLNGYLSIKAVSNKYLLKNE